MEAYQFICLHYEVDDEIILLGFSRGAFTVRCVIDLVVAAGILTRTGLKDLHVVFEKWWNNTELEDFSDFDRVQNLPQNPIKVCGLWDTVNSVGRAGVFGRTWPLGAEWDGPRALAPDHTYVTGVEHIFHALSLHERRRVFSPVLMSVPRQPQDGARRLEQCWFSGYHGDIGGGREDDALAHLALSWMMARLAPFVDFDVDAFWEGEMPSSSWKLNTFTGKTTHKRILPRYGHQL